MGIAHAHPLHYHGHSDIHLLAPEVKVAATFIFVLIVAFTPPRAVFAFVGYAVILAAVVGRAGLPPRFVFSRLLVIAPFIGFALFLPFVAGGPQMEVIGVSLSQSGLWSMFAIVVKASIGATASIVLSGTTEQFAILTGLERLRVPKVMVSIAAFMLRYLELIADDFARVRTAMSARLHEPRWLSDARPMASAAGALFVRSYERGERIHSAMLGRGFTGTMPDLRADAAPVSDWLAASVVPAAAAVIMVTTLVVS
jgi:cobalt/nickel transport system permease protein